MIFFLHWGQKEMLLPELYKGTCSSKEQANRTTKRANQRCKGVSSSPTCLHADNPKKWHTDPWPPRSDISYSDNHSTALAMVGV